MISLQGVLVAAAIVGATGALALLIWWAIDREAMRRLESMKSRQSVNPGALQLGPIRHERLSESQVARITRFKAIFAEVDRTSLQETVDNFRRDINPDGEIAIWEIMADCFKRLTESAVLSREAKREAFGILLTRSACSEEQTLSNLQLKYLSAEQVRELIRGFGDPKPIAVMKE